ncbi:MAG TPA: sulfate adenylyltransferase, partial [Gemmatimonadales bacterium]
MSDRLAAPHGGKLVNRLVDAGRARELRAASIDWPSWDLTPRQLCDLELLATGGFSPLEGFLSRRDYESVCAELRLAAGTVWPIPITLDVTEDLARRLQPGRPLALRDAEGVMLAILDVADVWEPDLMQEAEAVYGTRSLDHPGVAHLLQRSHHWYVGGRVEVIQLPQHYDHRSLRLTPLDLRAEFERLQWRTIVGFQTRNPMHRAHQEVTRRAAESLDANLLLHPVVGQTKAGDIDHYTRVRCYEAILPRYPAGSVRLALLPLAMRMAGPREALWHGLVRKNFGCTHFIVGRDHASPGKDSRGVHFYGRYDAQELFRRYEDEIGVRLVAFERLLYVPDLERHVPEGEVPPGARALTISGTELRQRLLEGREIPEWFSFPEVVRELRRRHPARAEQGVTVF